MSLKVIYILCYVKISFIMLKIIFYENSKYKIKTNLSLKLVIINFLTSEKKKKKVVKTCCLRHVQKILS